VKGFSLQKLLYNGREAFNFVHFAFVRCEEFGAFPVAKGFKTLSFLRATRAKT